jgi:hypothetical protein
VTVARDRRTVPVELVLPRDPDGWATLDLPATRAMVPHVLDWLRTRDAERLLRTVDAWPPATRLALRRLLTTQGLTALVADVLERSGTEAVPDGARDTVTWLAGQLAQGRERGARFADDLAAILVRADAIDLPVLPLKGGLIAFTRYREPGLRPMADLDLLVRPGDEAGLHEVLVALGYRRTNGPNAEHGVYRRPDERIVALDGTHPDNPRAVEVHARLRRSAWVDRGGVDLAPGLWASARPTSLLGQRAFVPDDAALLASVASHATGHLARGAGLALHWVDVATLATHPAATNDGGAPLGGDAAAWVYPPLALAARAFPDDRTEALAARLAPHVGSSLVRLAARVPLDDRAGLNVRGVHIVRLSWLRARWRRWRPNPWLVRLAHPDAPYPLAYGAYVAGVAARGVRHGLARASRRRG